MREFDEELEALKEKGLFRRLTPLESRSGSKISISGETFINFSSNDYLNLSEHPEIRKTAVAALKKYGFGSGASRLLSGTYASHIKLEDRIAEFKGTETALVFNSGYAANTGIIPAITGRDTMVFSDELNHASIVDGIRLSKVETKIYGHRDMNHLESLLKRYSIGRATKQRLIITDTVFSMDGDIAPLKDIVSLCEKYGSLLMIDDAHGTGVLGEKGRGGIEHFHIKADNIIQMGTFSKAFGCFGAFAAGSRDLVDLLINRARSFIYSTSLPPVVAEACIKAVNIVDSKSHNLRRKLWKNRQRLYGGLKDIGYDTLGSETPIIPILAGDVERAIKIGRHLYKNKIYAPAIRPPTVPEGRCRIRFSVSAGHTDEDIDLVLESLRKVW